MGFFEYDNNGEYELNRSTIQAFGEHLIHNKAGRDWTKIAHYDKVPKDGDGQSVDIYCVAMPAEFYRVDALPCVNSVNETVKAFSLTTGSGQSELVALIAKSISEGMLGLS